MTAKVSLYSGYSVDVLIYEFETEGKPPYGMGSSRDPERANFCAMPYEAPESPANYHVSKEHQTMIWYDYDPHDRTAKYVNIPPRGRIEISAVEA